MSWNIYGLVFNVRVLVFWDLGARFMVKDSVRVRVLVRLRVRV